MSVIFGQPVEGRPNEMFCWSTTTVAGDRMLHERK